MPKWLSDSEASHAFDLILPYVPELEPHIFDPSITEIMLNPNGTLYVDRRGQMQHMGDGTLDPENVVEALQRIARNSGGEIDDVTPSLDACLPDGSRIAAVLPPCAVGKWPMLTIRKFQHQYFSLRNLIDLGTFDQIDSHAHAERTTSSNLLVNRLLAAMRGNENILLSGQPGSGKTTLQNALLNELDPHQDRLVIIEESAEMQINAKNVGRLQCRTASLGLTPITIRDLVKIALRHRPDHLIIGEMRSGEALDLLDALNTGNSGSMTTIHANSAIQALTKLSNLALRNGSAIPYDSIQIQIASVINHVVHMKKEPYGDRRYVAEAIRIHNYNVQTKQFDTAPLARSTGESENLP
jgi:pilus assembly protein CpaF